MHQPLTAWFSHKGTVATNGNQLLFHGRAFGWTESVNSIALSTLGFLDHFAPSDDDRLTSEHYGPA